MSQYLNHFFAFYRNLDRKSAEYLEGFENTLLMLVFSIFNNNLLTLMTRFSLQLLTYSLKSYCDIDTWILPLISMLTTVNNPSSFIEWGVAGVGDKMGRRVAKEFIKMLPTLPTLNNREEANEARPNVLN